MTATFMAIDLTRQFRDVSNVMFVLLLPLLMYLVFGVTMDAGSIPIGDANVRFYVMSSMAAYGAALAATTSTGVAAMEQMQGWGRQVALTPVRPFQVVLGKVGVALVVTFAAMAVVHLGGLATGAQASVATWATTAGITLAGATMFALYGFAVAQLFKSESALGVATGVLILMSFVGNVFMPLSGWILEVSRFTPMYGFVGLVRWPLLHGHQVMADVDPDPLWLLLANVGAWSLVFAALAVIGVRRGRNRQ
ncbi:hypothetical protein GCM10028820_01720 [Tessaracoccus terricola]